MKHPVSFPVFFLIWAEIQRWEVPDVHIRICQWLESRGDLAVLMVFRGAGKSTLLAVYNAWRYYCDPTYRILHQGDQDATAYKTARDTKAVLARHPLTRHLAAAVRGDISFWWVPGAQDERNPSMQAAGILSNITSSRADEVQNDDVEVPKNIGTPEARAKLRYRLSEQTHILVPGGRKLFIGTPHTHNSIYEEEIKGGADVLRIPMFAQERRIEETTHATRYEVPFRPDYVFFGIHKPARLGQEGVDYRVSEAGTGWVLEFDAPPGEVLDLYAGCAWPERFTRKELEKRRKETKTLNEWDSQYQLHAKPIGQVRLDPEKVVAYECEPEIRFANGEVGMWLGGVRIASMALRWDPSSGKVDSDVSALALLLQDEHGKRYWHRALALAGEVAEFSADGKTITGGQVMQICELVRTFQVPRVTVETNGIGGFAPAVLKAALKQQGLHCGVSAEPAVTNKNKRILEAFEPLISSRQLWAHVSVLEGPVWEQMQQFNPAVSGQDDDYLDSAAGAITETPERVGKIVGKPSAVARDDWRPDAGVHEVELEF